jgi:rod shape-determining protein MreD
MFALPLGRLLDGLRRITPIASCFAMVLLGVVPHGLPQFPAVAPDLAMMAVFYWAIYRPDLLPNWAVFLIGLFQDVLTGVLLGLNVAVLLVVHYVGLSQRRAFIGKPFVVAWFGFMVLALGAGTLFWLVLSVMSGTISITRAVLFQHVLTFALFPVMSWLLVRAHRYVVG